MNTLITKGRLTRDPEIKALQSGTMVANFSLAVDSGFGAKKKTLFFECSAFGSLAERMEKAGVKKGSAIEVNAEFSVEEYPKNDGTKGNKLKLNIYHWSYAAFAEAKPKTDETSGNGSVDDGCIPMENLDEEDIPFLQ